MSAVIGFEVNLFLVSILWGAIIHIFYDVLRIVRRIIKHGYLAVALEDLVYWIICGVLIFRMMYNNNNGVVRGFIIAGVVLGMVIYRISISGLVVKYVSLVINRVITLFLKVFRVVMKPFRFLLKKTGRLLRFVRGKVKILTKHERKALKKFTRTVKIGIRKP